MTVLGAALLMVGVICLVALICALWVRMDKRRITKLEESGQGFDERQQVAQGRASNFGLMISSVYYSCVTIYLILCKNGEYPLDPLILVASGLFINSLSYNFYCMMTDAVLPLSRKPTGILCFIGGLIGLFAMVLGENEKGIPLTGEGSYQWFILFAFVSNIANAVIYWIAHFREKRSAK